MKTWRVRWCKTECGRQFIDEIDDGEEIFAGLAEGDVFGFHGGESDCSLEFTDPNDGAVAEIDDVAGTAAGAVWVLWRLVVPETAEVGVGIAVES